MSKRRSKPADHFAWMIEGYDGSRKIFQTQLNVNKLGRNQITALLKTLTAKAGLTFDEIVGAHLKKRTKGSTEHLCVNDDPQHHALTCGSNPHFVARVKKVP
jgi:hypothetical protein